MRPRLSFVIAFCAFVAGCGPRAIREVNRHSREPVAVEDVAAPASHNSVFVSETARYTGVERTARLSVDRVLLVDTMRAQIVVHYVDSAGHHLMGAGSGGRRGRWCFVSDSVSGTLTALQTDEFQVTEENDSVPTALALVLDHSGSMGTERALLLQRAVNDLIREKWPNDGIAVIKFDHEVAIERRLGVERTPIAQVGLIGYGGGTAIWDGVARGLTVLNTQEAVRRFPRRAVVLFTDGSDNSSTVTMERLVPAARRTGVPIFTVSFGANIDDVDEQRLRRISLLTGGRSYKIFSRQEFAPLFRDIYRRYKNYYLFSLNLATRGVHTITVRLCNQPDSVQARVVVDNRGTETDLSVPTPVYTPPPIALTFDDVLFEKASAEWLPGAPETLNAVADYLRHDPRLHATIEGHTSNTMGTPHSVLQRLSEDRARAVADYLVGSGVDVGRIRSIGYGPDIPIAPQWPDSVAARNRRVEVRFRTIEERMNNR